MPEGEALIATLNQYGLDERARSALRAYAAYEAGEAGHRRRVEAIETGSLDSGAGNSLRPQSLRQFSDPFASLPEADFAADWLRRLGDAWQALRRSGAAEDLPLRAARALVAHCSAELLRDRSALSQLEVEIIDALEAAAIWTAGMLCRLAPHGAQTVVDDFALGGQGTKLLAQLTSALEAAGSGEVGLLALRLHLGPGTLTLSRLQRDLLWNEVVERVRSLLRECDVLVRTESHGCAIVLPQLQTHAQVMLASGKLTRALEMPLIIDGASVKARVVIGVVWSPAHGHRAEDLIRCADLAVEAAVREERPVVTFDEQLLAVARWEARIEKEFPVALESGRLSLYVQPQVSLEGGRCIGGELLLRWIDSEGNPVPPYRIPEIAKRVGAAAQLTRWLLFDACRLLADLGREGLDLRLSANLMGRDVMDPELPLLVEQAASFWRVSPGRLTLELTEGMMLEDPAVGASVMRRLIELGVATSIDDFGIGYSSILYLRQLPLHELKIDCMFVGAMSHSRQDREIVASLVGLSHALGLQVVAEGVEDEQTMDLLREIGCDRAQGYRISRAMPAAEFAGWVRAWNQAHA